MERAYAGVEEVSSSGAAGESSSSFQEAECHAAESFSKSAAHLEPLGTLANVRLQVPAKQINSSSPNSRNSSAVSLQRPNFKNEVSVDDGERSSLLCSEIAPSSDTRTGTKNAALVNFIAAHDHGWNGWKRCVSLPVEPALDLSPSASGGETRIHHHASQENPTKVLRSLSVPIRNVILVRSGSFGSRKKLMSTDSEDGQICPKSVANGDVEIPEEEAVCRICLSELTEGRSWLKMECSCKGALRLTHEECAVKWFSIKGNKNCDVCGREVLNLPVTLFRVQSSAQRDNVHQLTRQSPSSQITREWQDAVVLTLISTMCYFFFLEQLLVKEMKAHAIIIAAPVSFTLAILSSVFAVTLVCKEYVWAYSAFQFSLVCVFLHLLYNTLQLRAVYAVLFSAIAGLGIAIGINSICLQLFAWRTRSVRAQMNANPA